MIFNFGVYTYFQSIQHHVNTHRDINMHVNMTHIHSHIKNMDKHEDSVAVI